MRYIRLTDSSGNRKKNSGGANGYAKVPEEAMYRIFCNFECPYYWKEREQFFVDLVDLNKCDRAAH